MIYNIRDEHIWIWLEAMRGTSRRVLLNVSKDDWSVRWYLLPEFYIFKTHINDIGKWIWNWFPCIFWISLWSHLPQKLKILHLISYILHLASYILYLTSYIFIFIFIFIILLSIDHFSFSNYSFDLSFFVLYLFITSPPVYIFSKIYLFVIEF